MEYQHEVIMCVVNAGFSEAVMDAAREFGARGGTVIHARGTANSEAEKLFNISVQPEKEIVMIIVERNIRDAILHGLYQKIGLQSAGQGIAFSLPIEDVVGLSEKPADLEEKARIAAENTKVAVAEFNPDEFVEKEKTFEIERAAIAMDKEKLLAELEALKKGGKE